MTVIEFAEKRLQEEIHQNDLGANNGHLIAYWSAYLDGAKAQKAESDKTRHEELNSAWKQGYKAASGKREAFYDLW